MRHPCARTYVLASSRLPCTLLDSLTQSLRIPCHRFITKISEIPPRMPRTPRTPRTATLRRARLVPHLVPHLVFLWSHCSTSNQALGVTCFKR
ncbi:MAG: hypothetical protein ABGY24_16780, partial [bacterium]